MVRALIPRKYNGVEIPQRVDDRYLNATKMCQAAGKLLADYRRNQATQEFLEALSSDMGIPISLLVQVRKGKFKDGGEQGTWIHPQVAIHLAQWLNAGFAVQVTAWILELATTGTVSITPQQQENVLPRAWGLRLSKSFEAHYRYITSRNPGSFTILTAIAVAMMVVEDVLFEHLFPLSERDLLDGSVGLHWNPYRREQGWPEVDVLAPLDLPGKNGESPRRIQVKVYPASELAAFNAWFATVYIPLHAPEYLKRKFKAFGTLPVASAADNTCRRICNRRANLPGAILREIDKSGGMIKANLALVAKGSG